jgi:hypothetical protein
MILDFRKVRLANGEFPFAGSRYAGQQEHDGEVTHEDDEVIYRP